MGDVAAIKKGRHRRDLYTLVDIEAEQFLREQLGRVVPNSGFIGEELRRSRRYSSSISMEGPGSLGVGELCWVADSIDGSLNFERGYPHFATSVALLHGSTVVYGCIYDARRQEMFECVRGSGQR
jgi:myo-inositol-1(or 4)-monophosphatase